MNKRTWLLIGLLLLGVILLAYPVAAQHPQSAIYFDDGGDRLTVASGGVFSAAPGSAFTVTNLAVRGDATISGDCTSSGARTASTWDTTTMQTTLSLTNGTEIVPTGSLQPINVTAGTANIGTGAITTTGIEIGSRLVLISQSTGATTIGITDTTGMTLTANFAMGRDDTLTLVRMGSGWVEVARADN